MGVLKYIGQSKKRSLIELLGQLPFSCQLYLLRRYGPCFFIYRALCRRHERFTQAQMYRYQCAKLQKLIRHIRILKIVRETDLTYEDEGYLKQRFSDLIDGRIKIKIAYVDKIEREPSGKYRYVVSKIFQNQLTNNSQRIAGILP